MSVRPPGGMTRATQAHEPSLYRVLRLPASLGVPTSMRSFAMMTDVGFRLFRPIIETVKTGKPGMDIAYGMGPLEFLAAHLDLAGTFQATMSERTAAFARSVAAGCDFSPMRAVADIGGGKGTLLAAILQAHGYLRGVLLDRPPVVADAAGIFCAAARRGHVHAGRDQGRRGAASSRQRSRAGRRQDRGRPRARRGRSPWDTRSPPRTSVFAMVPSAVVPAARVPRTTRRAGSAFQSLPGHR